VPSDADRTEAIVDRVRAAHADGTRLAIVGGGSKAFYGHPVDGEPLEIGDHRGIVNYDPTELVLTARAGTPLAEVEQALADNGQMLAAEPPSFGGAATLGGTVAAGLSGPRRPWAGALRDHVLGVRLVDGRGRPGRFGGEVMKNVAGYDVSRLVTGALGTLGVITEVSLKVLPRAQTERTVLLDERAESLYGLVERALRAGTPVTGAAHDGSGTRLRIAGADSAVAAGAERLGGDVREDDDWWRDLRDHGLRFFSDRAGQALWRLALPPGADLPGLDGERLLDWGGQQLWLWSNADAGHIRLAADRAGGHATRFRGPDDDTPAFTPLDPAIMALHQRIKSVLDPHGILNPGRMYPEI